jgi:6-phosphogluconolactonase (cycloisomerase 2 family)
LDVLYVWVNFQLLVTYDIDSTGKPTQVGQPLPLGQNVYTAVPSPDDHFLYVVSGGSDAPSLISVYPTDSDGVPQPKAIQTLNVPRDLYSLEISPNPHFAYAIGSYSNGHGFPIAQIRLFYVNPKTGRLNKSSRLEYTSQPDGPCGTGWSEDGTMFFNGFSSDGSKLYTEWYCTSHDSISGVYLAFDVNPTTGALGHPRKVFGWSENQSADGVWFTRKAAIDVGDPGYGQGLGWVNIYPPQGGTKLIFSCTAQMLEGCGYGGVPDPTGEYIFLRTSASGTDVAKIEIAKKRIVDTGNTSPNQFLSLSPDQRLMYTLTPNFNPITVVIYTFDPKTGGLQEGGTIQLPGQTFQLFPAVRK